MPEQITNVNILTIVESIQRRKFIPHMNMEKVMKIIKVIE